MADFPRLAGVKRDLGAYDDPELATIAAERALADAPLVRLGPGGEFTRDYPATPQCHYCGAGTDQDSLCYGCKHYVCADCDKLEPFGASHNNVSDHQTRRAGVLFGADE